MRVLNGQCLSPSASPSSKPAPLPVRGTARAAQVEDEIHAKELQLSEVCEFNELIGTLVTFR